MDTEFEYLFSDPFPESDNSWVAPKLTKDFLDEIFSVLIELVGNSPINRFDFIDSESVERCREIVKNCIGEIYKDNGVESWKWVTVLQGIHELPAKIKLGWRNAVSKQKSFTPKETKFFTRVIDNLEKLCFTAEATIKADPIIRDFRDKCFQDVDFGAIIRPRPLTLDEDEDEEEVPEPQPKKAESGAARKPTVEVREWTVIDDNDTHTTLTLSFKP